jgi:hypothetical protein
VFFLKLCVLLTCPGLIPCVLQAEVLPPTLMPPTVLPPPAAAAGSLAAAPPPLLPPPVLQPPPVAPPVLLPPPPAAAAAAYAPLPAAAATLGYGQQPYMDGSGSGSAGEDTAFNMLLSRCCGLTAWQCLIF